MTQIQCPKCKAWLKTKNSLGFHLIQEERCFPSSLDGIADKVNERISTIRGQVHFLLYLKPETRSSPEWLEKWHQVFFQHTHYYDATTQSFIERKGMETRQVKYAVKQGSIDRLRRYIQRADLLNYHDYASEADPERILLPHECIRASYQVQLIRNIQYEESTREWARR